MVSKIKFYRYKDIFLLSFCLLQNLSAISLDGRMTPAYRESRHTFNDGDYARGMVVFKDGITAAADANIIFDIPGGILNGNIVPADPTAPATLHLEGDLLLGSTAGFKGPFILDGRSNSLMLTSSHEILATTDDSASLRITGDMLIDGNGNELHFNAGSFLAVDAGVTVTLKNLIITKDPSSPSLPFIDAADNSAQVTLDNVVLNMNTDCLITDGRWYIHNDVLFSGTNRFCYSSTGTMYITSGAALAFDYTTTFSYGPGLSRRHTLSERDMLVMADKSSKLIFNDTTIYLPDAGMRLTQGTLIFDNRISIVNRSFGEVANTDLAKSFEWGDGTASGELEVIITGGANLDVDGAVYYHPAGE